MGRRRGGVRGRRRFEERDEHRRFAGHRANSKAVQGGRVERVEDPGDACVVLLHF